MTVDKKFLTIDSKIETLRERRQRANASIVADFDEKLDISWIYHDNALEGVVLSYSELKAAIDKNIISDVTLIPMYEEIKNHKAAIEYIRTQSQKRKLTITLDTLRRLYEILAPEAVGKPSPYRKDNPLHRLYYHEIAPPDKISQRMKKLVEWIESDEFREEHPVKRAARAHYRLLAIYPWTKNSGKVARLLMNLLLLRDGFPPVVIHSIERQRYYDVLRSESAGIVPLVLESLENGVETSTRFFEELQETKRS